MPKCLWKFSSGTYSHIVKEIAWEKWKYSTVETSLKGGVNIVFFFWIFLRTCVKVAAKNVVICRGTPQPLTNRVRYSFSFFPDLQKIEKINKKIKGNPTIKVPALSVNSRVYEICTVKVSFWDFIICSVYNLCSFHTSQSARKFRRFRTFQFVVKFWFRKQIFS